MPKYTSRGCAFTVQWSAIESSELVTQPGDNFTHNYGLINGPDGARFSVPESDCVLLPIAHSSAEELATEVTRRVPGFEVEYAPDFRQAIADSWPAVIDDSKAREDWGWHPAFDVGAMADDMLAHL